MRIISGVNKGMKLLSPMGEDIRPTIDRVKEAAFNIMQFSLENGVFLDMFSGTGQMGIEAIARGAAKAYFFDPSASSMKVIKANVEKCGFSEKAVLRQSSYIALAGMAPKPKFDLVYIDPPFASNLFEDALSFLVENELVVNGAIIIVETPKGKALPEKVGDFTAKTKHYGQISLTIYKNEEEL